MYTHICIYIYMCVCVYSPKAEICKKQVNRFLIIFVHLQDKLYTHTHIHFKKPDGTNAI